MGLPSLGLSGSDDGQDRRLVILILVVHATLPQDGEATLTPSIWSRSPIASKPS
jgi:hypothetical protein